MFLPLLPQSPPIQAQTLEVVTNQALLALTALLKAKDWGGLADWFETQPPTVRGTHYEYWIQALNRSQRWERLATVCEALTPQLEARQRRLMTNLVLETVVDPEGKPVSCRPRHSPWLAFFAATGAACGLEWRFHPARLDGLPQPARFRLTMPFRLRT